MVKGGSAEVCRLRAGRYPCQAPDSAAIFEATIPSTLPEQLLATFLNIDYCTKSCTTIPTGKQALWFARLSD
jgi:hypothetical protein